MWPVQRPTIDAGETFQVCISRVRTPDLRARLAGIRKDIEAAAADYEMMADLGCLHLISPTSSVGGSVSASEMVAVYEGRMVPVGSPGRSIYEQIKMLPSGDRCPFCDQRNVSTLDHFLPKALHPVFAVTPVNLVGSCIECNIAKMTLSATTAEDVFLHPYFENADTIQWLKGGVLHQSPCVVLFHVEPPSGWSAVTISRARLQFKLLNLASLYSSEAAREITNIRYNLDQHFQSGGADAVRGELERQWHSRRANRINSWQTAMYEALARDQWFHNGGYL